MSLQRDPSGPEARRVRFHPPEPDDSRRGEARIPFDVGGLPAGELKEFPNRGGSRWTVSSVDADLQGVAIGRGGSFEALDLGRTCRLVEEAAVGGAGGGWPLAEMERRRRSERPAPPESPVRFRPPRCMGGMGYAEIGVELDGRLVGHLREGPAARRGDGSQWIMYSRHRELDRIGTAEPLGLGEACLEVADAAERCRARLSADPERGPEVER